MLAAAFLACAAMVSPQDEKPFKPTAVHRGAQSRIATQRFELIEDATAWKKLWDDHDNKFAGPYFKVDFDKQCVACLFFGKHLIVPSFHKQSVESNSAIRIRFDDSFQFRPEPDGKEPDWTQPYLFVVFDRPNKPVIIERDVRGLIADPPKWKEIARFPGKDAK